MIKRILTLFIFFVFLFKANLHAQKKNHFIRIPNKDTIHLKFSSEGRLETTFRSRYKRKKYPVEALVEISKGKIKEDKNNIDETLKAINNVLKNKKGILYKMFEADTLVQTLSDVFDSTKFYTEAYNPVDTTFFPEEFKIYAQFSALLQEEYSEDCSINIKKFSKIFPLKFFFNNKELKLSDNSLFYDVSEKKYFAKYETNWDTKKEFSYQLKKESLLKKAAINWSNNLIAKSDSSLRILNLIQKVIFSQSANIASIETLIDSLDMTKQFPENNVWIPISNEITKKLVVKTNSIYNLIGNYDSLNIFLTSRILRNWVNKWLWLNGDVVQLNPFKFTTALAKGESDPLIDIDDSVRINYYDSTTKYLSHKISDEKSLDSIIARLNIVLKGKIERKNLNSKLTTAGSANDKALKDFTTVSNFLYKGSLLGYKGNGDRKIWARNYYFGESPPANTNSFKKYYPEDEYAAIFYHNVPGNVPLHIKFTYQPFPDSAAFTLNVANSIEPLVGLFTSLNPVIPIWKKIGALFSINEMHTNPSKVNDSIDSTQKVSDSTQKVSDSIQKIITKLNLNYSINSTLIAELNSKKDSLGKNLIDLQLIHDNLIQQLEKFEIIQLLVAKLDSQYRWRDYIHTLSVFTKSSPLITEKLNSINDTAAIYHSIYETPEAKDTSIICYGIYKESKGDKDKVELVKIDTSSYKISKLHYVELAAGIAYSPNAGNITSVDTSNGKFQINKDDDKFRLIAGIRWYPFGAYNQQNLLKRFDIKHAVSILAATGVPKPLENWYGGIGIDLVPGLNVNAGFHFQQKNKYTIENNSIKGREVSYTSYGFAGVTMDPGLLIKIFTSLFK